MDGLNGHIPDVGGRRQRFSLGNAGERGGGLVCIALPLVVRGVWVAAMRVLGAVRVPATATFGQEGSEAGRAVWVTT